MADPRKSLPLISPLAMYRTGSMSNSLDAELLSSLLGALQLSPLLAGDSDQQPGNLEDLLGKLGKISALSADDAEPQTDAAPVPVDDATDDSFDNTVERVRARLVEEEQELNRNHRELDETVDQLTGQTSSHSEVTILCASDGISGGRMLIHNPFGQAMDVEFKVHFGAVGLPERDPQDIVSIEPSSLQLKAGEAQAVRVVTNLSGVRLDGLKELKFRIEVLSDDSCLSICWLDVKVVDV